MNFCSLIPACLTALVLLYPDVLTSGNIVYVDVSATGAGTGENWTDAYTNIQAAVNDPDFANSAGNLVLIKEGVYRPTLNLSSAHSGDEGALNVVQAYSNQMVTVDPSEDYDETRFTLPPGKIYTYEATQALFYGGVYEIDTDTPYIRRWTTNDVESTVGSWHLEGTPSMLYIHTSDGAHPTNHTIRFGGSKGGIAIGMGSGASFIKLDGITCKYGVLVITSGTTSNNVLTNCTFRSFYGSSWGAYGIRIYQSCSNRITRCVFSNGASTGIYPDAGAAGNVIANNTFCGGRGGYAVYLAAARNTVRNNLIYNNSSGIQVLAADCYVENNTIFNSVYGIHLGWSGSPLISTIWNNICVSNSSYGIYMDPVRSSDFSYNCVWGNGANYGGAASADAGDISKDPLFVSTSAGDFHLKSRFGAKVGGTTWTTFPVHSPCIDAGDPESDYSNERHAGGRINMGAYGNTDEASFSPYRGTIIYIR